MLLRRIFPEWKRILFFVSVICLPVSGFSQISNFRNYSVDEGLPFVEVFTIYQDVSGNLWSGGYGGLSRFDGVSFTNFSPKNGLPNHWVTSITEDSRNSLWIATIDGISNYTGSKFINYGVKDGLPDKYVNCLLRDEKNVLWIGTAKGICKYDGEKFLADTSSGPGQYSILCFYQQPNTSRIWIGTSNGIYLSENGKYTHYALSVSSDDNVTAITIDNDGRILAGTSDGIFRLDNDLFRLIFTPAGFDMPSVNAMITDHNGVVWIAANNGLFSYDGKQFHGYRISTNENSNNIGSLFLDYEGSLWLGTHSGLYRFRGEGFTSFGPSDGLTGNFIYGIDRDASGRLWIGTEMSGAFLYDGDHFVEFSRKDGLASNKVNAVMKMDNGDMWLGTDRGLSIVTNGKSRNMHPADGLGSDSVNVIFKDRKGRVWLGGAKTITLYENGKFIPYHIPADANSIFDVWCLHDDADGNMWVGTYTGGLYIFDGKTFSDGSKKIGADADSYFSICEDNHGKLYFGTLDGIFIYDKTGTFHIDEANGLSSELIYCMTMDKEKNNLWVGTNQGISKFDVKAFNFDGDIHITTFGKEEGFTGVESNSNGTYLDSNGVIWFGTVNGLMKYTPTEYRTNSAFARTSITGIKLEYRDTILPNFAELSWNENNVAFDYVGICLTNPSKVRYRFMLEGFDPDYSPPTASRNARYSNLPPGTYTFKVISMNNEGLWNTTPTTFSFTIATPFWKRAWFWTLLTLASLGFLALVVYLRIRKIKLQERKESETQVAMAKNELKALRAQMNPHFVFNSLNSIQHFILTNKSQDAGKYLNKFARLMRVILNNSEKSVITLSEEMEYLRLYLELEEMRFENKFSWKIEIDDDIDADFFEIPAMLLQPYIENAILHGLTPKKTFGHLLIKIHLQGETLVCTIEDDGIGREKAREIRQLSKRKDHKSLGMKITHDRLELINRLHGSHLSLTITDLYDAEKKPAGTRVDIFIPVS
ncbi:MAG TPA: two-component regulator propeller domain-containing protein [Bacteroidia bacterium]|jgi:ligand-binding sensor domain-containing protein|nr:two-component regulator propeller domain-containing protein [Bacteroidia bacterium]